MIREKDEHIVVHSAMHKTQTHSLLLVYCLLSRFDQTKIKFKDVAAGSRPPKLEHEPKLLRSFQVVAANLFKAIRAKAVL